MHSSARPTSRAPPVLRLFRLVFLLFRRNFLSPAATAIFLYPTWTGTRSNNLYRLSPLVRGVDGCNKWEFKSESKTMDGIQRAKFNFGMNIYHIWKIDCCRIESFFESEIARRWRGHVSLVFANMLSRHGFV